MVEELVESRDVSNFLFGGRIAVLVFSGDLFPARLLVFADHPGNQSLKTGAPRWVLTAAAALVLLVINQVEEIFEPFRGRFFVLLVSRPQVVSQFMKPESAPDVYRPFAVVYFQQHGRVKVDVND